MSEAPIQQWDKKPGPFHASSVEAATVTYYYGLDISGYPGDSQMSAFWTNTPFWYTGFYLAPAPHHPDSSWMTKRTYLKNLGWGFLVIYVGRQEGDGGLLTYAQGQTDALSVSNLATQAGFPAGTTIFLDVEAGGGVLSSQLTSYIQGWVNKLDSSATPFWAGVYCNFYKIADLIKNAVGTDRCTFWCVNVNCTPSPGCNLPSPAPNPANCGVSYAVNWQFALSPKPAGINCTGYTSGQCKQTYGGYSLNVDLDTATSQNPSNG
ncbi:MAG: DUF1906 domain-containing protein [Chloroflexi bacterium]|nr:DUF1906 domain-containing protein [Chloroflexota bacterium]MBI3340722.1 DUF1906 domain-containing protein [Chloroflexota bacterium]